MQRREGFVHLVFLGLVLVVMAVFAVVYFLSSARFSNKSVVNNAKPTVKLQAQYNNPFDKDSQYANPFSQYKNPFAVNE